MAWLFLVYAHLPPLFGFQQGTAIEIPPAWGENTTSAISFDAESSVGAVAAAVAASWPSARAESKRTPPAAADSLRLPWLTRGGAADRFSLRVSLVFLVKIFCSSHEDSKFEICISLQRPRHAPVGGLILLH